MSDRNYWAMIEQKWQEQKYFCLGLDFNQKKIPTSMQGLDIYNAICSFNKILIDSTKDIVACYKPNFWFYLQYFKNGGLEGLAWTIEYIKDNTNVPVILDLKAGDTESTSEVIAIGAYEQFEADAITINPYMGILCTKALWENTNKGVFVTAKTSNPDSKTFQNLKTKESDDLIFQKVTDEFLALQQPNIGFVFGATFPTQLSRYRFENPSANILIPGVGTQGGGLTGTVHAAKEKFLINGGRSSIYHSDQSDSKYNDNLGLFVLENVQKSSNTIAELVNS